MGSMWYIICHVHGCTFKAVLPFTLVCCFHCHFLYMQVTLRACWRRGRGHPSPITSVTSRRTVNVRVLSSAMPSTSFWVCSADSSTCTHWASCTGTSSVSEGECGRTEGCLVRVCMHEQMHASKGLDIGASSDKVLGCIGTHS